VSHKTRLLLFIGLALIVRIILIPNPGFEADVSFWKSWGLATVDYGAVEGLKLTNNNYPTPFTYTLGAIVWTYGLFADPHNFQEFWSNTNVLFLTVSKMLPILADFGIAAFILSIGRGAVNRQPGALGFLTLIFRSWASHSTNYWRLFIYLIPSPLWMVRGGDR